MLINIRSSHTGGTFVRVKAHAREDLSSPASYQRRPIMTLISKLLHRKSTEQIAPPHAQPDLPATSDAPPDTAAPHSEIDAAVATVKGFAHHPAGHITNPPVLMTHPPQQAAAPIPVGVAAGPPRNMNPSEMQNAGMLAGFVAADVTGSSAGAGMVDGLVAGNIVGRRVNQMHKHAYWRAQALNYREGPRAGDPWLAVAPPAGRNRSRSREDRRRERWERRAERRS
jgi:hypothetical protein